MLNRNALKIKTLPNLPTDLIVQLADRINGIRILSSALTAGTEIGKFREFVRLYELAFSQPFTKLAKKLSQLFGEQSKISRAEITEWIKLKHPSTHADFKNTDYLAFDVDIAPHSFSMELAAYDLLLNKLRWGKNCSTRRPGPNVWAITDKLKVQVLDEFLAFYLQAHKVRITVNGWPVNPVTLLSKDRTT